MNNVLFVFLSLSVSGSILALILLALNPLIKNKLSQTWQYYIWLIVILRFLLPFAPQVSVVGEMSRYVQNISNPPATVEVDPGIDVNEEYTIPQTPDDTQAKPTPQNTGTETHVPPAYWRDILNNIWLLWIGVALVLLVHQVASYRSFVRFVKSGTIKITDTRILNIHQAVLVEAGIKRQLPLYENNQVASPMLVGIIRPSLVIPDLEASDNELRNILRHEVTHYKRLDFLYKWLVQITLCLHWFNPLVYLVNKQINKSCELSCDESVIKHLDEDGRITYGDALITSLKAQGNYSDFVVSMTMSENGNIVKERLDMIMSYKKKSGLMLCTTALLTILFLCGATFTGSYAADNPKEKSVSPNIAPQANAHFSYVEGKETPPYTSRTDSLSQNFEKYKQYGVIYNAEQDAVYYNGERAKLFVDFKPYKEKGMTYAFDLCYHDRNTDSTLYLEAVKDNSGNIAGVRRLKEEIASDLLTGMASAYQEPNKTKNETFYLNMDATQTIERYGIVAKDLTKEKSAANIQTWMEQCDKKQGAYILKTQAANEYITYIYFNGGGRYPWSLSVDNDEINVNLYSDSGLSTTDGYYLMYFTAPKDYAKINLHLDNIKLDIMPFEGIRNTQVSVPAT